MTKVRVKKYKAMAVIDMGYSGVIISKKCMSRLGLVTNAKIDFTLNTINGTAKKKILLFEKMKIGVSKNIVALLFIVVDRSYLIYY